MSKGSEETKSKILVAAKAEFLDKGFTSASLRTIAANAGLTTGAMYRHFKDKDALFCALVDPVIDYIIDTIISSGIGFHEQETDPVGNEHYAHEKEILEKLLDFVYSDFDTLILLFTKASGSTHENFLQELCDLFTENVMNLVDWMQEKKIVKRSCDKMTIHITATSFVTSFVEIVLHKLSRSEAEIFINNMQEFFHYGYMHILGLH